MRSWRGLFLRPLWDSPEATHKGLPFLVSWSRLPVVEAIVRIEDVVSVNVNDRASIGIYTLNEPERTGSGLRFHCDPELTIDLEIAGGIHGSYHERPAPGLRALYRQFFLVQTGPVIESDVYTYGTRRGGHS